jgi:vanadium chloroperoxidase
MGGLASSGIARYWPSWPFGSKTIERQKKMDQILYWNAVALEADRIAHTDPQDSERGSRGPVGSSRALGIVHLAMHDAYFSIVPAAHGTYLASPPSPAVGASSDAAIAAAAHSTLSALYPAQKARLLAAHSEAGLSGAGLAEGHAHGLAVGQALLALRRGDPGAGDDGYAADVAPGKHRPDPVNPGQGFYAPFYGARAHCFAVTSRHQLDAPPELTSLAYDDALEEVRGKGIAPEATGTLPAKLEARTPEETLIGLFWGYDGAKNLGTPPRFYNQIVRAVATHANAGAGNTLEQNARLFALVNAAMADAGILAWDDKYNYDLWRPVLGIREHDSSNGPIGQSGHGLDSDTDPFWVPFGAQKSNEPGVPNFTPPFPSYPSGHATFGAAALQVTRRFYSVTADGPDQLANGLSFVSDELNGTTVDNHGVVRTRHARKFPHGLWQMIEENARSRVFLGVHWIFDAFAVDANGEMDLNQNIGGVRLGYDVANDLAANGLKAANAAGPRLP